MKMRSFLWDFKRKFGLDETPECAYVKPLFVVKILFNDFFSKEMPTWKIVKGKRIATGFKSGITMRHPRLAEIRRDKSPSVFDCGISQLKIIKGA